MKETRSQLGAEALPVLLITVVIIGAVWLAKEIIVPIALAVLVSFLLAPGVRFLQRRGFARWLGVITVSLAFWGPIVGLGYVVASQFSQTAAMLPQNKDNIARMVLAMGGPGGRTLAQAAEVREALDPAKAKESDKDPSKDAAKEVVAGKTEKAPADAAAPHVAAASDVVGPPAPANEEAKEAKAAPVPVQIVPAGPNAVDVVSQAFMLLANPLSILLLVFVLTSFILASYEDLRGRLLKVVSGVNVEFTLKATDEIADRVSRFLRAQLVVNLSFGVCIGVGLWIFGVPSAILWGAMAGALRFVPYVGAWIAAIFPIALSLATTDGWARPIEIVALFLGLEMILGNIIEPLLYGSSTGVSPIGLIVAAAFWTWLWGIPGLLLSTPLTVVLVTGGKHIRGLRLLYVMLGDDPDRKKSSAKRTKSPAAADTAVSSTSPA